MQRKANDFTKSTFASLKCTSTLHKKLKCGRIDNIHGDFVHDFIAHVQKKIFTSFR